MLKLFRKSYGYSSDEVHVQIKSILILVEMNVSN